MRTIDLLQAKRDEIFEVAQCHGVTSIRVFGSDTRGAETAERDVDLLVITGPKVGSGFLPACYSILGTCPDGISMSSRKPGLMHCFGIRC